jgi:exodeoxyribonuclease V alpha subunit
MTAFTAPDKDQRYSPLARHFADFIVRLNSEPSSELYLAAFLVIDATTNGHICLNLHSLENQVFPVGGKVPVSSPAVDAWTDTLRRSPVVGAPGEFKPLILDKKNRLYTYRYWNYESVVADLITEMAGRKGTFLPTISPDVCNNLTKRLFPEAATLGGQPRGQIIAAFIALTRDFCLITGSPGTGKTTAVARILAFILELTGNKETKIVLSAPTAKAAIRLQEAIARAKQTLPSPDWIKNLIPEKALTIHRLLGSRADGIHYNYDKNNFLTYDIIVVDEASMVDLPLMSHLLEAIPPTAKLILLGDPHQLSSVEAGAVLGDICGAGEANQFSPEFIHAIQKYSGLDFPAANLTPAPALRDSLVELRTNYRVDDRSTLGQFKKAVIEGNPGYAFEILESKGEALQWIDLADAGSLKTFIETQIGKYLNEYMKKVNDCADIKSILAFFDTFRVLCAIHGGLFGTVNLNRLMEKYLKDISGGLRQGGIHFPGKAVMIGKNDYPRQLFNGDLGLILTEKDGKDHLSVYFREPGDAIRQVSPYALPEHETAFAMTVHKSQGSEYDRVFLFLPEQDLPVVTRELLYTGITRARRGLTVICRKEILAAAISRKVSRNSGLTEKIWKRL